MQSGENCGGLDGTIVSDNNLNDATFITERATEFEEERLQPIVLPIANDGSSRKLRDEIIQTSVAGNQPRSKAAQIQQSYDGLGLDLEPPNAPSSTNVQDTLF